MTSWNQELNLTARGWAVFGSVVGIFAVLWAVWVGLRARSEPLRCRPGFLALGPRCCAPGQGISGGMCVGEPEYCPAPYQLVQTPTVGCVHPAARVKIAGATVTLGPTDWDSAEVVERASLSAPSFLMDKTEIDHHRYDECLRAEVCPPLQTPAREPGVPVTGLSPQQASQVCAYLGGQLPTPSQWLVAASGSENRRFPWGPHGLVCRRAVFGLLDGPCATGGTSAEISGMRPAGSTPQGLLDMAGNVAELTVDEQGQASYRGGSFGSNMARQLKVWGDWQGGADSQMGFRCVYPAEGVYPPEER